MHHRSSNLSRAPRAPRALTPRALILCAALCALAVLTAAAGPAAAAGPLTARAEAPQPRFNRLHDFNEVEAMLRGWAAAYPDWVELESIGKSAEGRDIWVLTLDNPATGDDLDKPAMYIDGNIHANEIQGAEAVLYIIDYMLANYGRLDRLTELMDRAAFYFVPSVNPDGRQRWFDNPSTPNFPRTVVVAVDDDRDGVADEDGLDDLNGDGVITQMRKRVPMGQGGFLLDPNDPRIGERTEDGEEGDYVYLGSEGIDNDGDGRINEDDIGYLDPNRSWGYGWQPQYVQTGAGPYPLSIPETRSIALWAIGHPNIGTMQSFHNSGGMILRGPGAKLNPSYPGPDVQVYDLIGEVGETIIPNYRYWIVWKDLYTAYGGTTDHFYGVHGAISFTNELYRQEVVVDLDGDEEVTPQEQMKFNDLLTLGRQFIDWVEVEHPQYGTVEVGGYRQDVGRIPEMWLLEEEMHRNAAFSLFQAHHLPLLELGEVEVERLDGDLYRLQVTVHNRRGIPTVPAQVRQNKLHRVDLATVDGARVLAAGVVMNPLTGDLQPQEHRPERLLVDGVAGHSAQVLFFLVEGSGEVTFRYDSIKGGELEQTIRLR